MASQKGTSRCNCAHGSGVRQYASLLANYAPCGWRFLLAQQQFRFLAKASDLTEIITGSHFLREQIILFVGLKKKEKEIPGLR